MYETLKLTTVHKNYEIAIFAAILFRWQYAICILWHLQQKFMGCSFTLLHLEIGLGNNIWPSTLKHSFRRLGRVDIFDFLKITAIVHSLLEMLSKYEVFWILKSIVLEWADQSCKAYLFMSSRPLFCGFVQDALVFMQQFWCYGHKLWS